MKKIFKHFDKVTIIVLSLFTIFFVVQVSSYNTFRGDDAGYSYDVDIFDTILGGNSNNHGGGYIGWFLCQFFCFFLPNLLHLHPSDFIGVPCGIIKGIFMVLIMLLIANFSNIFEKSKLLFTSVFVFLIPYIINSSYIPVSSVWCVSYTYFRYFFYFIFYAIFWFFIAKNILNMKQNTGVIAIIGLSVLGFICATGVEITIFQCVTLSALIFLHYLVVRFLFKNQNDENNFRINKAFTIPSIFIYIAAYMFTHNPGYKAVAMDRGLGSISVSFQDFIEFSKLFLKIYVLNEYIYWLIFIIAITFCFYLAIKNKEIIKAFFPLYMQISTIIVINSLILCGKTNYDMNFFLTHNNIIFLYKIILLFPLLYCISYIYSKINNKKKLGISLIFIIQALVLICTKGYHIYSHLVEGNKVNKEAKVKMYMVEKMTRFYYMKKQTPVLPLIDNLNLDLPHLRGVEANGTRCLKNVYTTVYYAYTYKDDFAKDQDYCVSEDAINEFYKNGGVFYKHELEDVKFQRLFNNDFVSEEKLTPNEAQKIFEK